MTNEQQKAAIEEAVTEYFGYVPKYALDKQAEEFYIDGMKEVLNHPENYGLQPVNQWISVEDGCPLCYSTGDWDGRQSDVVLAETITGKKFLAQCYEGVVDGSEFYDWYQVDEINKNDWLVTEYVFRWMAIE